ncbi:MAG: HNH endonuclease [Lachnospiraceae bacterium]|nr:HNH endonuclease [Lachnospiraceae bacterium]
MFSPGISIGAELTNEEMRSLFKCGNMGGMRRSKQTGTLVIISDDTKGLYRDVWKNGVLHYTGMGKVGDQVLEGNQNETLYYSDTNGVEVHLFEVLQKAVYTYRGIVKLVDKPYKSTQPDDNGNMREVWMFPVMPISEMAQGISRELSEQEISKLSDKELARYASVKNVNKEPKTTETVVYYRDPYLKQLVKRIADGKCQYCGNDAPFLDKEGQPYLEEHHVVRLADGGKDVIDNVVAICPNCHRKMHVLKNETDLVVLTSIASHNRRQLEKYLGISEMYERKYKKHER